MGTLAEMRAVAKRMKQRGVSRKARSLFMRAYKKISADEDLRCDIRPVDSRMIMSLPKPPGPAYRRLERTGRLNLDKCAIIKLNGEKTTAYAGGEVPTCVIKADNNMSYLDINLKQMVAVNEANHLEMPVALMNSSFTDHVTMEFVADAPLMLMNFVQNDFPLVRERDLTPLDTGSEADWRAAGDGDFYSSFTDSGLLDGLLQLGIRYAFISTIDNYTVTPAPVILGAMVEGEYDFLMEVTGKMEQDTDCEIPVLQNGRLAFLENSQVMEETQNDGYESFSTGYLNTRNLWIDLESMRKKMAQGNFDLPVRMSKSRVNQSRVIQVETHIGDAANNFDHPGLIEVPRNRYSPVLPIHDVLSLQTDLYIMSKGYRVIRNPRWSGVLPN